MDFVSYDEELYRLKFREYLRRKKGLPASSLENLLVADTIIQKKPDQKRPVGRDRGEIRHAIIDEDSADQSVIGEHGTAVDRIPEQSDPSRLDAARESLPAPAQARIAMEEGVRKSKRSRVPCPHCKPGRVCALPFIRCGERMQYSTRESLSQQSRPHRCNYDPASAGSHVLVVSRNKSVSDFLANSLVLFLRFDPASVIRARSGEEAIVLLNDCKLGNRRCSLVVSDIAMPGMNGFELVNEIFSRNWETNVILMKEKKGCVPKPKHYTGDTEIVPGEPLVRAVIEKPFHSDDLIKIVAALV
jgi:CheY-like chemotaxis protein